jgi:phosphonate transport system substrate-binding protein
MIRYGALAALVLLSGTMWPQSDEKPLTYATMPDGLSPSERQPLVDYLTSQLKRNVRLVTPESYDEVLDGLANGDIDFACIGGVTYVRAHAKAGGIPLVQRPGDLQFHSVFITGAESRIRKLSDLVGKKFAYGDVHSTSGHVIYLELKRAGLNPDTDLSFRYTGSHPLTMKLVEAGIVEQAPLTRASWPIWSRAEKLTATKSGSSTRRNLS